MISSPTKWSNIVPDKKENIIRLHNSSILNVTLILLMLNKILPHKASFMPVSTLSILGGSTPGVSSKWMTGLSQTYKTQK